LAFGSNREIVMKSQGIIIKIKPTYGFILVEDIKQVFFHVGQWLSKDLPKEFDAVEFDLVRSHKPQFKECANNVRKIVPPISGAAINSLAEKDSDREGN
jgi:hypothetical protein